jgi:DNA-binding beta-propeller fold protein YncE
VSTLSLVASTSPGPPAASAPGLYDCRGLLLVAVPGHNNTNAKIFDQEYTLQVQPGGNTLTITRWVRSDNLEDRCRIFVEKRANETKRRKRDMQALQGDILAKLAEFEDEYLDTEPSEIIKGGLPDLLVLRGKHKAELKELESYADVKVAITETRKGESVELPLKELVQLDFFEEPVVYLHGPLVAAAVQITEVVEKLVVPLSAWQAEQIGGTYVSTMGLGHGSGDGQLKPNGMVVSDDSVFVVEFENHRVSVFSRRSGDFVRKFGGEGAGDGQLRHPCGLAVSGEHVFVADTANNRISVHTKQGVFVRTIGNGKGSDAGQLNEPMGVAVSGEQLFVVDTRNHRLSVFTVGGGFISSFGTPGVDLGQLRNPIGVAVTDNMVFVADQANHRISVFRHDGGFVRVFGSEGAGNGQFRNPTGMCVAGDRLFVTDLNNHRVSVHRLDGTFVREFGAEGVGDNQFRQPGAVVVAGDRLFVADLSNRRVQVFL